MTEATENPQVNDDGLPPVVQVVPGITVTRQAGLTGDVAGERLIEPPGPTADGTTTSPPTLFADRYPD